MKPSPERAGMPAPTTIPAMLPVFEHKGKLVADSRDVAPFVEKDHAHLLRDVRRYVKAIDKSLNPKLVSVDYFIPATYIDPTGRELPSFYLTEMGCEMVANKMTGDKGILFTAQYVQVPCHAGRTGPAAGITGHRQADPAEPDGRAAGQRRGGADEGPRLRHLYQPGL